jgi:peptide/nickel transport system substrate-binding protein
MNYPIQFLYSQDDPVSVDVKDAIVKGLTAGGFKPEPVATTVADLSTVRSDPDAKINVRSAGWCSDWPTGSSWFPPVIKSTNLKEEGLGANYAVFNEPAVDKQISDIQLMPLDKQPGAWNDLDKEVLTKYFPLFNTGYAGVAMMHGSKIEGMHNDNTYGMPTWRDIWVKQ